MYFFALPNLVPALGLIAVSALVTFLAGSIRNGNVEVLSGYDASRVTDKARLAAWAGGNLRLLGRWQLAGGLLAIGSVPIGGVVFFLVTIFLVGRTALGSHQFHR